MPRLRNSHPRLSFYMKRTTGRPETTPGEVISPLEHTHGENSTTEPGQVLGTLNEGAGQKSKKSTDKSAKERLEKPAEDRRGITIGPTTKSGPDITIEPS